MRGRNIDYVVCVFCGRKEKILTSHLKSEHNMTRKEYEKSTGELGVCKSVVKRAKSTGSRTFKLYPELARMNGFKTHRIYPNLSSESGKKCHKLHPNLGHENGLKTQYLHPNLSSNNLKSARLKNPNLSSNAGKRSYELHPNQPSENGKKTHRLHPNLARENGKKVQKLYPNLSHENGLKAIETLRNNKPYAWQGVHFDSNEERECAKKLLSKPREGINCHYKLNGKEIDFYPQDNDLKHQGCFVEYHPWDMGGKTHEEYYKERQKIIDNSIYKGTCLVLITNLKQLEIACLESPLLLKKEKGE